MSRIPYLDETSRIIIQKGRWSTQRYINAVRTYRRLATEFRIYNMLYFHGLLEEPTLDADDGPARYLPWTWCGSIFVNLEMAEQEPWRLVKETLLQQMVHQHLLQHLKLDEDPAHTRAFQQFCEQPRVRPALSMTYGLPGYASAAQSPDEERLHQRLQRLLALGESSNRHEAEAALQEAHRLMLKHNIDLGLVADVHQQRYGLRHLGHPRDTINAGERALSSLLSKHFFVKVIFVHSFNLRLDREGVILEICGARGNLDVACHVYHFLYAAAGRLWQARRRELGAATNRGRADFLHGVFRGFDSGLDAKKRRDQVEGLIWLGDSGLDDFHSSLHPKKGNLKPTREVRDDAAFLAGFTAGRSLELHRPIAAAEPSALAIAETEDRSADEGAEGAPA